MAKKVVTTINDIRPIDLPAFRRNQWFETAKTIIQIVLMSVLVLALLVFLILVVMSGTSNLLPVTDGTQALSKLFVEIAANAKTVVLFALGFFFREYLNGKNIMK